MVAEGNQIVCRHCSYTSKCIPAMTIHIMINHLRVDASLAPTIIGQKCYDCLWDNVVPFTLDVKGNKYKRVAELGVRRMLLPC